MGTSQTSQTSPGKPNHRGLDLEKTSRLRSRQNFFLDIPFDRTIEEAELPADGGRIVYHPGASTTHGKDGSLLRFRPNDRREWVGCFAFGHDSYPFTRVFSSPNPDYACVISKGAAYWVNAASSEHCQALEFFPVLVARALPDEGLLLLSDFITLCLMGGGRNFLEEPATLLG
jgi:hypothetical protein